jgi:hypothetical protein
LGRLDEARTALRNLESRVGSSMHWYLGRELAEALQVRMLVLDGRPIEAFARFTSAIAIAESADVYNAAWLTSVCADSLFEFDPTAIRSSIQRYTSRVKALGYAEMTRRYEVLSKR